MTPVLRKRITLFGLLYFIIAVSVAQQKQSSYLRSQLTLITENDNYTLRLKDRYYTNGLGLRYSRALPSKKYKKIFHGETGQMIFTPYRLNSSYELTMDRPYTGFLYAKGGLSYLFTGGHQLQWAVLTGIIGAAARGKEVQRWHHRNFRLPYPHGWESQLPSEIGLNVEAVYHHPLQKRSRRSPFWDSYGKGELVAGTLFTRVSGGLVVRAGLLKNPEESSFWDGHLTAPVLHKNAQDYELYLVWEPIITYQLYNATVQGGLFTGDASSYTTEIQPVYFTQQSGMVYAKDRWKVQAGLVFKTREAKTMRANEVYGSLRISYRF